MVHILHQASPLRLGNEKGGAPLQDNTKHSVIKLKESRYRVPICICMLHMPLKSTRIYSLPTQRVYAGGNTTVDKLIVKTGKGKNDESLELDEPGDQGVPVGRVLSQTESLQHPRQKRTRRGRKITVRKDDLIPGAVFPGKVIAIQPFGAFVDIGAFCDGLIHISRLCNSYVRAVEDVVTIGQEVYVQVLYVKFDARRIYFMLKDISDAEQAPIDNLRNAGNEQGICRARQESLKSTIELQKGQSVTGVVKNKAKSGVFVSLPHGGEGFLHSSEMNMVQSQLQKGQKISVRVLLIRKGKIELTMKREIDINALNKSLNKDLTEGATNPFKLAFQQNELFARYLEEKERLEKVVTQQATEVIGKEEVDEGPLIERLPTKDENLYKRGQRSCSDNVGFGREQTPWKRGG